MRKIYYAVIISISLHCFSANISAQVTDLPIEIKSLSVDVSSDLFKASTILDIELFNPNNKILDGEYNFSLNDGQVVTGFALDINGHMREGVITDKQQGRVAYENTIRRRIDPGLLEMTTDNNYKVRVYPMPANGTRKIKIAIEELLTSKGDSLFYSLPLDIPYLVRQFSVAINYKGTLAPVTEGSGILKKSTFLFTDKNYLLQYKDKNVRLKTALAFYIPLPGENKIAWQQHTDSSALFAVHTKPLVTPVAGKLYSSATVFWDVSSSSEKRNTKKDIEFLENFIRQNKLEHLTIVSFSNTINGSQAFHGKSIMNAVRRFLQGQQFDGGTRIASIDCSEFDADAFLLFSDGMNNFGDRSIKLNGKPIYCINSSPVSNQAFLKEIATKSGGRYVDLFNSELSVAIAEFNKPQKKLLGLATKDNKDVSGMKLPLDFTGWLTISGEVKRDAEALILKYGDNGRITNLDTIDFDSKTINVSIKDINVLSDYYRLRSMHNDETMKQFATAHKIVSKTTSFIVLDNLMDYIDYAIEPPAELQDEYKKMYDEVNRRKREKEEAEANEIINNLEKSVSLFNERIKWWQKDEPLLDLKKVNQIYSDGIKGTTKQNVDKTQNEDEKQKAFNDVFKTNSAALNEVVIVGYSVQRRRNLTGSVAVINSNELNYSTSVAQALQGRVTGVSVVQNNSIAGDVARIYIRGANTLGADREPLYVLDGIPVDAQTIASLSTTNIENILVYKDIQASILYGSRAANGAIVITSKQPSRNISQQKNDVVKYKDLPDVDYVDELNEVDKDKLYERYLAMKDSLGKQPSFYFDAAQLLFEAGHKENALRVLSNLAELNAENHQLLRGMAYVLENWGMYDKAIEVYKQVLAIKEEEPQSYRDLALAYENNNQHQEAVNVLYNSLTKNWFQYENRYRGLKSMLLNEMNAIINRNKQNINLSKINAAIIRPLPVDLRIVVDWNKDETDIDLHVTEPNGETCYYSNRFTKSGGRLSEDFTQGYGPEEYEIKNAEKGKYSIKVNYYGDRYQKEQVPSFVKLTIYKNFGKPDQSVSTQTLIMDHQQGMVEIAEIKW
ncbi:MAG: VIT domain-containing protein [Chitinophagaceae bacterium]